MGRVRVFGCFDLRHDEDLLARLQRDSRSADSPFELIAWSTPHGACPDWEASLRSTLAGVDEVIVLCGEHADTSLEMSAELRIVQDQVKPYFLIYGRRNAACTKPATARGADVHYSWIWEIVKGQIGVALRARQGAGSPA